MEYSLKEALSINDTQIDIDNSRYKKILDEIQTELNSNKNELMKLNNIDKEFYDFDIKVEKLNEIIEESNDISKNTKSNNIVVSYFGDPYITLRLIIEAIRTNNKIILLIEDCMLGVNKLIINIVKMVLKDYKIENKIFLYNQIQMEEILENKDKIYKIIFIGNKETFDLYKKIDLENIKYYPYNNIDLYCETEEFENLQKMIYQYCVKNNIDIEIYDEFENIEKAIEFLNKYGSRFCTCLLTKSKEHEKLFKENIKSEYIFVNENPFGNIKFNVSKYLN